MNFLSTQFNRFPKHRLRTKGNSLILVTMLLASIILPVGIWALSYSRLVGSHHQQETAIEAAALTAAQDLALVTIEDPDFGFIAISDYGPTGKATLAGDRFCLPVRGINTIAGTCRLDMIIADLLNDNTLRECAKRDYQFYVTANANLSKELNRAIKSGEKALAPDGSIIEILKHAERTYNANRITISSPSSKLVPNSLKIALGYNPGGTTVTPIPTPSQYAEISADKQEAGMYKSDIRIPYKNFDFVFCSVGRNAALIDSAQFQSSLQNLPYGLASIVKCQAVQQVEYIGTNYSKANCRLGAVAFAKPGAAQIKSQNLGYLAISLPNGSIAGLNSLLSILNNPQVAKSPTDRTQTSLDGDSPPSKLEPYMLPILNFEHAPFGQLLRYSFYDWLKRAGPTLNVQSLLTIFDRPLKSNPSPHMNIIYAKSNGILEIESTEIDPALTLSVSQHQWYAVSGSLFESSMGDKYDGFIRDYVYQPGRIKGGKHAGEPIPVPPLNSPLPAHPQNSLEENSSTFHSFPNGPIEGSPRYSYNQPCIAVEWRFRKR